MDGARLDNAELRAAPGFAAVSRPQATPAEIIERFESELDESGCEVRLLRKPSGNPSTANYYPFIYPPSEGGRSFGHHLDIEPGRTKAEKEVSRRHEGAHAILWSRSAAAHASPYNAASPIVLCPRDWVKLVLLSERAAMAYTGLLGFMDDSEAIKRATDLEPVTTQDFADAMTANRHVVEVALNRVARESLTRNSNFYMKPWGERPTQEALTLYNYYIWQALYSYEDSNLFNYEYELHDGPSPLFVRLSDRDILEIGEMAGFSAFGRGRPDSFFAANPEPMWKHQRWLQSLNVKIGIINENELPTVTDALRDHFGVTPQQFVAFSRQFKHGDAPLPPRPQNPKVVAFTAPEGYSAGPA